MVIARFGCWPSFHDGEVHRLTLDRTSRVSAGRAIPTLEFFLRGWIMKPEVTEAGFYKLDADSVVHFVFEDVFDLDLEGFNQQNVITALNLSVVPAVDGKPEALHVELEHCYLFSCEFKALRGWVEAVVPYVDQGGSKA